jgi:SAM-dependent methyltransferase
MRTVRPAIRVGWDALHARFPDRYALEWRAEFDRRVADALAPDQSILDVGAGREPTVPLASRPAGCRYVGLDISRSELERAPRGSYDELVVADVTQPLPALADRFDLVLSFQVLEHVKPLELAMENLRRYARPRGRLVAQLSGTFSPFGLANRLIPQRTSMWLMRQLLHRDPETVFPAHYDRCWYAALERMLDTWTTGTVVCWWMGAGYFDFLRPLLASYIAYEEWARLAGRPNLAPYYVIDATR